MFGRGSAKYPALTFWNKAAPPSERLHESLTWKWWPLELFPHKYFDEEGRKRWRLAPWPHRRELRSGALIHPSTRERLAKDAKYEPENLREGTIVNYSEAPIPLPDPKVMEQLANEGFGVYTAPVKGQKAGGAGIAVGVAAAAGLALLLWRRR